MARTDNCDSITHSRKARNTRVFSSFNFRDLADKSKPEFKREKK